MPSSTSPSSSTTYPQSTTTPSSSAPPLESSTLITAERNSNSKFELFDEKIKNLQSIVKKLNKNYENVQNELLNKKKIIKNNNNDDYMKLFKKIDKICKNVKNVLENVGDILKECEEEKVEENKSTPEEDNLEKEEGSKKEKEGEENKSTPSPKDDDLEKEKEDKEENENTPEETNGLEMQEENKEENKNTTEDDNLEKRKKERREKENKNNYLNGSSLIMIDEDLRETEKMNTENENQIAVAINEEINNEVEKNHEEVNNEVETEENSNQNNDDSNPKENINENKSDKENDSEKENVKDDEENSNVMNNEAKIRVVALEKLLDPKIREVTPTNENENKTSRMTRRQSRFLSVTATATKNNANDSVIVLEDSTSNDENDEDNLTVASLKSKSIKNKRSTKMTEFYKSKNNKEKGTKLNKGKGQNKMKNFKRNDETHRNKDNPEPSSSSSSSKETNVNDGENTSTITISTKNNLKHQEKEIQNNTECRRCHVKIKKDQKIEKLIKDSKRKIPLKKLSSSLVTSSSSSMRSGGDLSRRSSRQESKDDNASKKYTKELENKNAVINKEQKEINQHSSSPEPTTSLKLNKNCKKRKKLKSSKVKKLGVMSDSEMSNDDCDLTTNENNTEKNNKNADDAISISETSSSGSSSSSSSSSEDDDDEEQEDGEENAEEGDDAEEEEDNNSSKVSNGEFTSMGGLKYKISLRKEATSNGDDGENSKDNGTDEENSADGGKSSGDESVVLKKRRKKTEPNKINDETSTKEAKAAQNGSDEENGKDEEVSGSDSSDDDGKNGKKRKRRKRIRSVSNSDSGSDNDDSPNKKRKNIRKLIKTKDLDSETKLAARQEEERRKRIEERQRLYNEYYEKPESVELKELVLDFDEKTKKPLLKVDDGLLKKLKPHQATGVKFMWDACFETIKDAKKKSGSGCILAHCMGLGKTLQIVTLTHTLLTNNDKTDVERVLVIAPLSTLNNWAREFLQWLKFCKNKNIEIYDLSKWKDKKTRIFKLNEWFEEGGVCIVGYDMFRILSSPTGKSKKQREKLQKCLVDPGPDLVVCDEGHLLKNEKTSLSKAVTKMRTMRRIVLTGTPLQNNLKEYYCMIQFIKPNLLGTYKEYMNRFVNPITNGQYTDSTERDIRLMKHRSHVLHKLLEGCIQRRDYSVLAPYLPPKHEYVVFIQLTELQQKLYELYMTSQKDLIGDQSGKGAKLFQDFCNLRRIWTHPLALKMDADSAYKKKMEKAMFSEEDDDEGSLKDFIDDEDQSTEASSGSESESFDSDKSDGSGNKNKTGRGVRRTRQNANEFNDDTEIVEKTDERPPEWWSAECKEDAIKNIFESPKLLLLLHILQECEKIGDKVLVFSQSLQSLDVIEYFLSLVDRKTNSENFDEDANIGSFEGSWTPGLDYFRLDGSRTVDNRDAMCKSFNDPNNLRARLFLISTRAGGLGINLVAANRVIIFDVSWNPSHDTQSIFRVYRFGQNKPCYIYRFIAMGTMEEKVYERQVTKQATAKRVLDEQQISRHYNQNDLLELYRYELKPSKPKEIPVLPKDRLFADLLSTYEKLIYKYHEHDSLLENEESENLSEEERKAAWEDFEAEKNRPAYQPYIRANYGTMNGPVTSNKIFGFRTDVLLRLLNMKISQDFPDLAEKQVYEMVPLYMQKLYAQINNTDYTLYNELLRLCASLQVPPSGSYYINPMAMQQGGVVNTQQNMNMMGNANIMGGNVNMQHGNNPNPYYLQLHQQQNRFIQQQQQAAQQRKQNMPTNPVPSTSSNEVYEID